MSHYNVIVFVNKKNNVQSVEVDKNQFEESLKLIKINLYNPACPTQRTH